MNKKEKIVVIKIGGSTLGNHDTTLEDLVTLQKQGVSMVVVHGGAQIATNWLRRMEIPTSFKNGLRVTDGRTLEVVTAVLAGLVNKGLVASIASFGGKAIGISGVDGNLVKAEIRAPELGFTGEAVKVNVTLLLALLKAGYIPVIAPITLGSAEELKKGIKLLNSNADNIASEIATVLKVEKLVFLTDVSGIYDSSGKVISRLTKGEVEKLASSGIASGGMSVKVDACLRALAEVMLIRIIDGRVPHALLQEMEGKEMGTTIIGRQ